MRPRFQWIAALAAALLVTLAMPARAMAGPKPPSGKKSRRGWWARVNRAQATQPRWMTPLVTVTPLLAEEFRFDAVRETAPNGSTTVDFFDGKGLELIPTERVELLAGVPDYLDRGSGPATPSGWADFPVLAKYRLVSAPSGEGDYVLTAFFGATFPTGTAGNGAGKVVFRPSLAVGKGWGAFDVQATFGAAIPAGTWRQLGTPLALNTAFQYRVFEKLWPEVEVNSTMWPNGASSGKKETFVTPGLLVGRFPLWGRTGLAFGAGIQIAVTHFHRTNHNLIFSVRFPF
jgi:hypothetical protein